MKEGIRRGHHFLRGRLSTRVQISVKTRKVAAADLESQSMPFTKEVTGRPQVDRESIALPRLQRGRPLLRITIPSPDDPLSQVLCESIGPNID